MAVGDTVDHLLENSLRCVFIQVLTLFHKLKQVATISILHDQQKVLRALEDFEQADDIGVADFLEDVDFLHYLLLGVSVLHVALVDGFDGHLSASQFVDTKSHLAKSTFSDELNKLVEF